MKRPLASTGSPIITRLRSAGGGVLVAESPPDRDRAPRCSSSTRPVMSCPATVMSAFAHRRSGCCGGPLPGPGGPGSLGIERAKILYPPGGIDWNTNLPCSSISAKDRSIGVAASSSLTRFSCTLRASTPGGTTSWPSMRATCVICSWRSMPPFSSPAETGIIVDGVGDEPGNRRWHSRSPARSAPASAPAGRPGG